MREVFKPSPDVYRDAERVFYTITVDDVGAGHIRTTEGTIDVAHVLGRVLPEDVGIRLYKLPTRDTCPWVAETRRQRDVRKINSAKPWLSSD